MTAGESEPETAETSDTEARLEERALLEELGVDPHNPKLETAIIELQAGVTPDLPFGPPAAPSRERSPLRTAFTATIGVVLAALLAFGLWQVANILILLVIALFMATGLNAAVELAQSWGWPRRRSVWLVLGTIALLMIGVVVGIAPQIVAQATELREEAPALVAGLAEDNPTFGRLDRQFQLVERVERVTSDEALAGQEEQILGLAQRVGTSAFATLTVIVLTVYCVAHYPTIKRSAYRLVPRSRRGRVSLLGDEILSRVGRYLIGAVVTATIAGVSAAAFLAVMGVPRPLALAFVVAVLGLIPLIGATIGAVLSVAVAFTVSAPVGLATIVFFAVYQLIENFAIAPRIMSRAVDVAPGATIVAVLIGAALLGVLGALLAVPMAAAVQLIVSEVWRPRQEAA